MLRVYEENACLIEANASKPSPLRISLPKVKNVTEK